MTLLSKSRAQRLEEAASESESDAHDTANDAEQYVSRAEFDAFVRAVAIVIDNLERARERDGYLDGKLGYRLKRILAEPKEFRVSGAALDALKRLTRALSDIAGNDEAADCRRRAARATSARAFNF